MVAPCFVSGTHIRTSRGEVCVEDLQVGDHTISPDGSEASIKWIGWRRIPAHVVRPSNSCPIRILRNAFGEGTPHRDLLVSRDHGIYAEGVLIPAWCLLNGATIAEESSARDVTYYHVELEAHGLLVAEGLATESYLDTGNRSLFSNGPHATTLHPVFAHEPYTSHACAPQVFGGPLGQKVRGQLIERARRLGFGLTEDPDLSLLVDGRSVEPGSIKGRLWGFSLSEGTREVRILTRSAMPIGVSAQSEDRRPLGLAIYRVTLRCEDHTEEIALDDRRFADGFYDVERSDGTAWRWTNGDARLSFPVPLAMCELEFLGHGHRYWVLDSSRRAAVRA
jgi:hypothetical protein